MEETMITMPMWLNMALAVLTALGGIELVKYLLSLRANRRKDKAEAGQQEAIAGQQDADLRKKEFDLMNQFVATAKQQFEDLKHRYDTLLAEKDDDRKIKSELRLTVAEHERKIDGLQRAFTESESRRRAAERLYCAVEECPQRKPPLGTYDSANQQPRKKNGQFAKRKIET